MDLHGSASAFAAGANLGSTNWLNLPQAMLTEFEVLTKSNDPLHTDQEWVQSRTDFSTTIVPGFLTLSLLPWFFLELDKTPDGFTALNYGLEHVRWTDSIPVDSQIRANFTSAGVKARPRNQAGYIVSFDVTVETYGKEKPAMIATWLGAMVPDKQM